MSICLLLRKNLKNKVADLRSAQNEGGSSHDGGSSDSASQNFSGNYQDLLGTQSGEVFDAVSVRTASTSVSGNGECQSLNIFFFFVKKLIFV